MRDAGRPAPRSVGPRVHRPRDRAAKCVIVAHACRCPSIWRKAHALAELAWPWAAAAVEERGICISGFSGHLGDLAASVVGPCGHRQPPTQKPGPAVGAPPTAGANKLRSGGTAVQGKTERSWTGGEKSQRPIVPRKAGKPPRATRRRKGASRAMEPLEGQMTERSGSDPISTRRERTADLAARMPEMPLTTLAHYIGHAWLNVQPPQPPTKPGHLALSTACSGEACRQRRCRCARSETCFGCGKRMACLNVRSPSITPVPALRSPVRRLPEVPKDPLLSDRRPLRAPPAPPA